jgi:anion transporter
MEAETELLPVNVQSIAKPQSLLLPSKDTLIVLLALAVGCAVWTMPPFTPLGAKGMHFLATMIVAVTLWVLEVLDEFIVGLMLLLSWVVFGIVPAKVALAGFSENSWFFTVGALGIAAAIGKTSLLQRLSLKLLRWIPIHCQKAYSLILLSAGVLSGPLLPTGKARAAVAVPVSQAITQAAGFAPRSNGSAAISLSAFIGFSQMSFMFLTASEFCLIGWNFLPPSAKAEFGWLSWFVATLPAVLTISLFMFFAVQLLLPMSPQDKASLAATAVRAEVMMPGSFTRKEWITLTTLILTVVGWLTTSFHGVNEAWVALAALLIFLLTGVLDKKGFRNDLDWGLILFFGVLNSLAVVASTLKVDAFFMTLSGHLLGGFAGQPLGFLLILFLLVSTVRFFLRKTPTAVLFTVTILPLSESVGIHPGILVVALIMIGECFLLGYQDGPYQIAYSGGGGSAFSHSQARKILGAKYLATLLAIAVSVPYWRFFGFIR